jgi:hypothetical protein
MPSRPGTDTPQPGPGAPGLATSQGGPDQAANRQRDAAAGSASSSAMRWVAAPVAVGVLVVYILGLWVLFSHRGDVHWDRIVYLFSGFESIVFVAVGAIFGTTVQRSSVDAAQSQAQQARTDAQAEHARANQAETRSASGTALAASVRAYAAAQSSRPPSTADPDPRHGAGIRATTPVPSDAGLGLLVQLTDELFPPTGSRPTG